MSNNLTLLNVVHGPTSASPALWDAEMVLILLTKVFCFCATVPNRVTLNIELRLTAQPGHFCGATGTKAVK